MAVKFANNASSTLASSISDTDTSLTLADASAFPSLTGDEWFPLTVVNGSGDMEIMRVTARSGDTLTIERGQEGTTAVAFTSGSKCELRITAAALADLAPVGGGGGAGKYTTTIGNDVDEEFTITHNLGTKDVIVQFRPINPVNSADFPILIHPDGAPESWQAYDGSGLFRLDVYEAQTSRTDNEIFIEAGFTDIAGETGSSIPTDSISVLVIG